MGEDVHCPRGMLFVTQAIHHKEESNVIRALSKLRSFCGYVDVLGAQLFQIKPGDSVFDVLLCGQTTHSIVVKITLLCGCFGIEYYFPAQPRNSMSLFTALVCVYMTGQKTVFVSHDIGHWSYTPRALPVSSRLRKRTITDQIGPNRLRL
jgi:hypothetical protein